MSRLTSTRNPGTTKLLQIERFDTTLFQTWTVQVIWFQMSILDRVCIAVQCAVNFRVRNFSFKKSSHIESSVTDRNRDLSVKAVFRLQIRSETLTTCTVQLIWLHKFYCNSVLKSYPIMKKAKFKNVSRSQELISQYDHRVGITC